MTRKRGHWGRLLESRLLDERQLPGGPFIRCEACKTGDHGRCRNRAMDEGELTDCYCRYQGHESRRRPRDTTDTRPDDIEADRESARVESDRIDRDESRLP